MLRLHRFHIQNMLMASLQWFDWCCFTASFTCAQVAATLNTKPATPTMQQQPPPPHQQQVAPQVLSTITQVAPRIRRTPLHQMPPNLVRPRQPLQHMALHGANPLVMMVPQQKQQQQQQQQQQFQQGMQGPHHPGHELTKHSVHATEFVPMHDRATTTAVPGDQTSGSKSGGDPRFSRFNQA